MEEKNKLFVFHKEEETKMPKYKQVADVATSRCNALIAYLPDYAVPTYSIYNDYMNHEQREEANGIVFHIDETLPYRDVLQAKREIFKLLREQDD